MMKFKSLFRRAQGSATSSVSSSTSTTTTTTSATPVAVASAHTEHSNNNRLRSPSTASLSSPPTAAVKHEAPPTPDGEQERASKYFAPTPREAERGVDVGDDPTVTVTTTSTLPHKKSKLKGPKQPKKTTAPPPVSRAASPELQQPFSVDSTSGHRVAGSHAAATAMTPHARTHMAATPAIQQQHQQRNSNNNYAQLPDKVAPAPAPTSASVVAIGDRDCNELYVQTSAGSTGSGGGSSYYPGLQHQQQLHYQAQKQQKQQFMNMEQANQQQQLQISETNNKMHELQAQLECLARENLLLENRIAELLPLQSELHKVKSEMAKIQNLQEKYQLEVGSLKYENESLRNRLRDVVNSPLSDSEKHQIIQDSQRLHSSAPASIALPNNEVDASSGTPCVTPDWDKHSSSSEISVACLQDKITQMEETHYSTNEELQATLQELADLQAQLADTQAENERLVEEKDVLFQSLCRQTEKLNESRTQILTLQELLLRDTKQAEACSTEREKKLLDLVKTSQEERDKALHGQEELAAELQGTRQALELSQQESGRQRECIALLNTKLELATAERKQCEASLQKAKEEISQHTIEIERLSVLLENARAKNDELEADLARGEKTDLSEILDSARREKDALEERAADLQDQCSRNQAEIRRLKEQMAGLAEECELATKNAKSTITQMECRFEQAQREKDKLTADCQQLSENCADLQAQSRCHHEEQTRMQSRLNETQACLNDMKLRLSEADARLESERSLRKQETEDWEQFQADLLMTVRVANDFKTEAMCEREQLLIENKTQKEKIRLLEQQIEKQTKQQVQQSETQSAVISSVQQEMACRRNKVTGTVTGFSRQDSRLSVKTLIESIENNKQSKQEETEAMNDAGVAAASMGIQINSQITEAAESPILGNLRLPNISNTASANNGTTSGNASGLPSPYSATCTKNLLAEASQTQTTQSTLVSNLSYSSLSKTVYGTGERKDPLNMLAKNGGSKRNALLKWCQNKTVGYRNIDITNFSSSWNDGLAFCAILHSYLPDRIPYDTLSPQNKRRNFSLAFAAAETVGITTTLSINDMCQIERPDWTQVMAYVTAIYKHFET